ncbi:NrpR regulatory domain-containing protein [Chloroflexota bacterium]
MAIKEAIELEKAGGQVTPRHIFIQKEGSAVSDSDPRELIGTQPDGKVILETARIDSIAYQSSFHPENCTGNVPVNLSLFSKADFSQAVKSIGRAFRVGLCVSDLVAVAGEGKRLGGMIIPRGNIGLMTLSQIAVKGALLKAGIPVYSKFGGLIQIRNFEPLRFVDLIEYTGISLDPSEVFITAKMTSVNEAIRNGSGKILAGFWEIPSSARPKAEVVREKLEMRGMGGFLKLGKEGESICETSVRLGRVGMIIIDGLNPVAAAVEAGATMINHHVSGLIEFSKLRSFRDLCGNWG